jgi:hypothetical protein
MRLHYEDKLLTVCRKIIVFSLHNIRLDKNVPAETNTHETKELLDAVCSMRSVS